MKISFRDSIGAAVLILVLWPGGIATAASMPLQPFDARSMESIARTNAGKPYILVLWSLYCEPCREEMPHWGALRRKHPEVPIVLVATDGRDEDSKVRGFLATVDLRGVETWTFADEFVERVRYSIDRSWRGELPRTYFFDAAHRRETRSGKVDPKWLRDWYARSKGR